MSATAAWYDRERVGTPGSVVLQRWMAAGGASKSNPMNAGNWSLGSAGRGSELYDILTGGNSVGGMNVSEQTVMNVTAVYASVSLMGGVLASMPLSFFRRGQDDEREAIKSDYWWMFNEQPFACWPAAVAWEYAMASLLLQGDSFWRIHRASRLSSKIVGFEPLHPLTVTVYRLDDRLAYDVAPQPQQSQPGAAIPTLDQDDVLHIPGPGFNGLYGQSQIRSVLRTAAGVALAADQHSAAFFANGARPDYALQTDAKLDSNQTKDLRDQIASIHGGPTNAFKPFILQGGLKIQPITMNAEDAQLLDTRRFQIEDIARIFGVPPHMIGHTDKVSAWGTGIEQLSIGFIKYTMQRHLVKFEQEINRKVFRTAGNFCEFNTSGLERGDIKTRHEAYRIALGRAGEKAWMVVDEIRRKENLPMRPADEINPPAPLPAAGAATPTAPGVTDEPATPAEPAATYHAPGVLNAS